MAVRSLWTWLLLGALLASSYANFALYRKQDESRPSKATIESWDADVVRSHHLSPGSNDENCPTLDLLNLSQEQRDRIRRCSLTSLDLRTDLAIKIEDASQELHALLSTYPADPERVLEVADRVSSLRSEQYHAWIGSILVVRDVLTPDQLKRLQDLEAK